MQALRALAVNLAAERHPLSGLAAGSRPFLRTVASSPELISRARELLDELEQALGVLLAATGPADAADAKLLAALIIAAYRSVVTETVGQVMRGDPLPEVAAGHRRRLDAAFDVLETAAAPLGPGGGH